jgi:hypothetical protein
LNPSVASIISMAFAVVGSSSINNTRIWQSLLQLQFPSQLRL